MLTSKRSATQRCGSARMVAACPSFMQVSWTVTWAERTGVPEATRGVQVMDVIDVGRGKDVFTDLAQVQSGGRFPSSAVAQARQVVGHALARHREGIGELGRIDGSARQGEQDPGADRVRDRISEPGQHRRLGEGFHGPKYIAECTQAIVREHRPLDPRHR